jgi:hypothetical protein
MHENVNFPFILFGKIKSLGAFGPLSLYQVGQAARGLPDGDWLVGITLIEIEESAVYRLSRLIIDPEAC